MTVQGAAQSHPAGSGLYRIDGAGANWTNLYNAGATSVLSLAVSSQNPQLALAVAPQGILRTADGGATWKLVVGAACESAASCGSPLIVSPPSVSAVAIDPTNDSYVYAVGAYGIFASQDSGETWQDSGFDVRNTDLYRMWVDANQPQVAFFSIDQNLYRTSVEAGVNRGLAGWQQVATSKGPVSMAFDPFVKDRVYAATQSILQVSNDDGLTWSSLGQPDTAFPPQYILADPAHQGTLYATSYGGIFRSADSGATWSRIGSDGNAGPMVANAASGALYFWIAGTIFKTTDGLATRTPVGPASPQQVTALAVAGSSLYAGVAATTDVFVTKLDPQGNTIYSTYFGGSGTDTAHGIAVDSQGAAYVTGVTNSADFPVTAGAYAKAGASFLFKLNPDGSVAYSTYFADSLSQSNAIAVDSEGHAYLAGTTYGDLPVTPGVYQGRLLGTAQPTIAPGPPLPAAANGFLTEFAADGAALAYSTYFGAQNVTANALALESDGTAIVAGGGALYHIYSGGLSLVGAATVPGTINALAVDSANNVYAAGGTGLELFSGTPGAFQTAAIVTPQYPGAMGNFAPGDAFVAKFDSQLRPLASTLLGGEAADQAQSLALSSSGNLILGGSTNSKSFPTRGAAQTSFAGSTSFLAAVTPDLSSLQFSTYEGDARTFSIAGVAAMPDGGAIYAGSTQPSNNPLPYVAASPVTQALVARATVTMPAALRLDSVTNTASHLGVALSPGETFTVTGAGFGSDAALSVDGTQLPLIAQSATSLTATLPLNFSAQLPAQPLEFYTPSAAIVTVQSGGATASLFAPLTGAGPGIFSVDGSGVGQAYVLNADGTLNSPSNPAMEASKITIYATGVGPLTLSGGYAVTSEQVEVLVDGFLAPGIAAVLAPVNGLPGNVYQISVYVPQPSTIYGGQSPLKGYHLPSQSAITFVANPGGSVNGVTGLMSQPGLAISVAH